MLPCWHIPLTTIQVTVESAVSQVLEFKLLVPLLGACTFHTSKS